MPRFAERDLVGGRSADRGRKGPPVYPQPLFMRRTLDFWDEDSGYHFVAATPQGEPDLWVQFLDGARAAYRRFGAEGALEYASIRDGTSTSLFFAAVTTDGVVQGGSRAGAVRQRTRVARLPGMDRSRHPGEDRADTRRYVPHGSSR